MYLFRKTVILFLILLTSKYIKELSAFIIELKNTKSYHPLLCKNLAHPSYELN